MSRPRSRMKRTFILLWFCAVIASARAGADVYVSETAPKAQSKLDKLVLTGLQAQKLKSELCSDAVFVRRVYLDAIGTLPTAAEARGFIEDQEPNKRALLIDKLLERDEFADYWALKWGDILRIKAEFPVNLWPNAAQAYHRWVRASIAENKPYNEFVREMLTSSGSNFRVGPVNFYRAVQNRTADGVASAVALTFMGARAEAWPEERLTGMAVFFSQIGYKPTREWKEENVFWDPLNSTALITNPPPAGTIALPTNKPPEMAMFPDGRKTKLPPNRDPREVFADWLITPKNPWFTRNIANRCWAWLVGRGIIHEPDDIRPDNPPSNPALLAYLEKELIASGYDFKHLCRVILNSQAYQFASVQEGDIALAEKTFARYPLRRLEAEVLIDAINKITGSTDLYTSAIPEPFTYIPSDEPAIAIADGSITSPFLALFGRSARATGMENERANNIVPAQYLHLLNSSHIQRKLEQGPKLRELLDSKKKSQELLEELYLTVLSRLPTAEEIKAAEEYGKPVAGRAARTRTREDWLDITWALINSTEFLYRH